MRRAQTSPSESATVKSRDPAVRHGTRYTRFDPDQAVLIEAQWIDLPDFPGTSAIWGGNGRDDAGNIYLGVCTVWTPEAPQPSARVYRLSDPETQPHVVGDVIGELKGAGLMRQAQLSLGRNGRIAADSAEGTPTVCRESQMKIHTKFVTMDDGWVYFASMDEWNESEDGSRLPYWGSHLWRYRERDGRWQRLATVPEGLIAISGVGRYVFSLGYFGHVVYCYDTQSGRLACKEVGSFGGHISRNLLSSAAGRVFVPRVTKRDQGGADDPPVAGGSELDVTLVELDHRLKDVNATTLRHYRATGGFDSHGITGIAYLADESMVFTTAEGFLYRITPRDDGPADVQEVGWFHPEGRAYCPSLFSIDGARFLWGLASRKGVPGFDWILYDLETAQSTAQPFETPRAPAPGLRSLLLYGSNTRDDAGNFYVVGRYKTTDPPRELPLCLRVSISQGDRASTAGLPEDRLPGGRP